MRHQRQCLGAPHAHAVNTNAMPHHSYSVLQYLILLEPVASRHRLRPACGGIRLGPHRTGIDIVQPDLDPSITRTCRHSPFSGAQSATMSASITLRRKLQPRHIRTHPGLLAVAICPATGQPSPQPQSSSTRIARTESIRRTWTCRRRSGTGTCSFAARPPGTGRRTRSWICCGARSRSACRL